MSSVNDGQIDDILQLVGLVTEDAVHKTLQARFYTHKYYTSVGPLLLSINPVTDERSSQALQMRIQPDDKLRTVIDRALSRLNDTEYPQSIILSGLAGSGKTFHTSLIIQYLFHKTNGLDSASFRNTDAALTVLWKMTEAQSEHCDLSSRMCVYLEFDVMDNVINKTKINSFFIDHCRVTSAANTNCNFHIFYAMLAGLTTEECDFLHLTGYGISNLHYLSQTQHKTLDRRKLEISFTDWKSSLTTLGIPPGDIMRILAAVLLLGNILFEDTPTLQLHVLGEKELQSVCALLRVSVHTLFMALTSKSCQSRGQVYSICLNATCANKRLEMLAQALYTRTISAIVKRANNSHRSSSSPSHNGTIPSPAHRNGILIKGPTKKKVTPMGSNSSMHTRQLPGGSFLGLLDMPGFEAFDDNSLEQLCINLCSETQQHFYNTFVFKTTEEAYIEEGIQADMEVYYYENASIVELLSSQKTGLLSLLEAECFLPNGNSGSYMKKVRIQHKKNKHIEINSKHEDHFTIKHFIKDVEYNAGTFIDKNQQSLPDDIVWLFSKKNCAFGFASHIFAQELKHMEAYGAQPKGYDFTLPSRFSLNQDSIMNKSCASQDFHIHLDSVLRTIVKTQPHFICCLKANPRQERTVFERECITQQIRAYQVLETAHLMCSGFPHHMRYKAFNARFRILHPLLLRNWPRSPTDSTYVESKQILEYLNQTNSYTSINTQWALGKKNIFISESVLQLLERRRDDKRWQSAVCIQTVWRRHRYMTAWPILKRQLQLLRRHSSHGHRKMASVQPRTRTLSVGSLVTESLPDLKFRQCSYDDVRIEQTQAPQLPVRRSYTVRGNRKITYPQVRRMTQNYSEPGLSTLSEGENIKVIRNSRRHGYLDVQYRNTVIQIPFQFTELQDNKIADV